MGLRSFPAFVIVLVVLIMNVKVFMPDGFMHMSKSLASLLGHKNTAKAVEARVISANTLNAAAKLKLLPSQPARG